MPAIRGQETISQKLRSMAEELEASRSDVLLTADECVKSYIDNHNDKQQYRDAARMSRALSHALNQLKDILYKAAVKAERVEERLDDIWVS